ncbi:hypothetical protein [Emticicia sp. 17c]|uniref:hypothetical protein n=1 Tax=Emticicia sp. 17c TaxID=3127704 RepID=UPI00301C23CF
MKKFITIALVSVLSTTAAFANDDTNKQASKEETKVVKTKESIKLIKKENKKANRLLREKNLFC